MKSTQENIIQLWYKVFKWVQYFSLEIASSRQFIVVEIFQCRTFNEIVKAVYLYSYNPLLLSLIQALNLKNVLEDFREERNQNISSARIVYESMVTQFTDAC